MPKLGTDHAGYSITHAVMKDRAAGACEAALVPDIRSSRQFLRTSKDKVEGRPIRASA